MLYHFLKGNAMTFIRFFAFFGMPGVHLLLWLVLSCVFALDGQAMVFFWEKSV
jgi:hypothetical protein